VSAFADARSIPPKEIWPGIVARAVESERLSLALLELAADSVVPAHSHEAEQLGFLLEGSLTFTVGDEVAELRPGGSWRILAHVPHSVVVGPEGAVVIEVFSPRRDDWSVIPASEPAPGRWPQEHEST
jgi:quercetin dioxygenase-like cupin family protein